MHLPPLGSHSFCSRVVQIDSTHLIHQSSPATMVSVLSRARSPPLFWPWAPRSPSIVCRWRHSGTHLRSRERKENQIDRESSVSLYRKYLENLRSADSWSPPYQPVRLYQPTETGNAYTRDRDRRRDRFFFFDCELQSAITRYRKE
jgi:hypothetical protein